MDPSTSDTYRLNYEAKPGYVGRQESDGNNLTTHEGVGIEPATPEEARKPIQYRF